MLLTSRFKLENLWECEDLCLAVLICVNETVLVPSHFLLFARLNCVLAALL